MVVMYIAFTKIVRGGAFRLSATLLLA